MSYQKITEDHRKLIAKHFNPELSNRTNAKKIVKLEGLQISHDAFRHYVGTYRKELMEESNASDYVTDVTSVFEFDSDTEIVMIPARGMKKRRHTKYLTGIIRH